MSVEDLTAQLQQSTEYLDDVDVSLVTADSEGLKLAVVDFADTLASAVAKNVVVIEMLNKVLDPYTKAQQSLNDGADLIRRALAGSGQEGVVETQRVLGLQESQLPTIMAGILAVSSALSDAHTRLGPVSGLVHDQLRAVVELVGKTAEARSMNFATKQNVNDISGRL